MTVKTKVDTPAQKRLLDVFLSQEGVLFLITIGAMMFLTTRSEAFLTADNLLNQLRLLAEVGLLAMPMTFIIITGGIDLSVGSILGLSAIMLGFSWDEWGIPLEFAPLVAIGTGIICGFINGIFIVRVGVPPLIMTLATLALYRGLAEAVSEAKSVTGYPEWFFQLGQGSFLGVPTQVWLLLATVLFSWLVLWRTKLGRALYAIGNNEVGARFSGIPVDRYKLLIYTYSGLMAGITGWIFVSRFTTTRSDMGNGIELDVIAAVVLGGTNIFGGSGSIPGTVIGVLLIRLLTNGLSLTGVTGDASIVVIGVVLILAILINNLIQNRNQLPIFQILRRRFRAS